MLFNSLLTLLLLSIFILDAYCCRIQFKVKSMTKRPFEFEAILPSINKHTERLRIEKQGVQKKTLVQGRNCQSKAWILRVYGLRNNDEDNFVKIHQVTAKFDGDGEVTIAIMDDLLPRVVSREGVACSETLICG